MHVQALGEGAHLSSFSLLLSPRKRDLTLSAVHVYIVLSFQILIQMLYSFSVSPNINLTLLFAIVLADLLSENIG